MAYDDNLACGVAFAQSFDRGHGAAGHAFDSFG